MIALFGVVCSPTFSEVVVVVAVAWALVTAASKSRSRIARLPQPLRLFVDVATDLFRVGAAAVDLSYQWYPSLPPATYPKLYVIGDSVSAGIGNHVTT